MKKPNNSFSNIPFILVLAMGIFTTIELLGPIMSPSNVDASVANQTLIGETGKFENPLLGIKFDASPSWNNSYQDNETMILLYNNTTTEEAPGFVVSRITLPADNMNEEFLVSTNLFELMNNNSSSYVILEEGKSNITQQQVESHRVLLSDGKEYTLVYMFKLGNDFFTVVFSSPKTLFEGLLPEVHTMIGSLEFIA